MAHTFFLGEKLLSELCFGRFWLDRAWYGLDSAWESPQARWQRPERVAPDDKITWLDLRSELIPGLLFWQRASLAEFEFEETGGKPGV